MPLKDWYSDLPEPAVSYKVRSTRDPYFRAIQNNMVQLKEHVQRIQVEERDILDDYISQLRVFDKAAEDNPDNKPDDEDLETARLEFLEKLASVRKQRKQYRALLYDALMQRTNMMKAAEIRYDEEREKDLALWSLGRHKEVDYFLFFLFTLQMLLILLYIVFVDFDLTTRTLVLAERTAAEGFEAAYFYTYFRSSLLAVFLGFGLLAIFVRKYSFSALTYGFLVAAFALEWGVFWLGVFAEQARQVQPDSGSLQKIFVGIPHLQSAVYSALAVVISFGAVLGRFDPLQLGFMAMMETLLYSLNIYVAWALHRSGNVGGDLQGDTEPAYHQYLFGDFLGRVDPGGSMFVHMFGAFFGVCVGRVAARPARANTVDDRDETADYSSNTFAFIGTVLLFALFPALNAALAPSHLQGRIAFNTFLALCASTATAASTARIHFQLAQVGNRWHPIEIQRATLAGGIIVASLASHTASPGIALVLGVIGGFISVGSMKYFSPFLKSVSPISLGDSTLSLSLHGLIGLLGGLAGIVMVAADGEGSLEIFGRESEGQTKLQVAFLGITLGIAIVGGLITGLIIRIFNAPSLFRVQPEPANRFQDDVFFHVPKDGSYPWRNPMAF